MIWRFREPNHLYFKTSYVEVYLNPDPDCGALCIHFKTSYVEVYLVISGIVAVFYEFQNILCWSLSQGRGDTPHIYHISKHLMLKFIQSQCHTIIPRPVFQNILCWSLSKTDRVKTGRIDISKHLMLKFIVLTSLAEPDILYFKTSYVEVYLQPAL